MQLAPHEWLLLGAGVGWILHALAVWLIPKWRFIDIVIMNDSELVRHMLACAAEWVYRHPEHRPDYERAVAGLKEQL
jgi:hypothetical protein